MEYLILITVHFPPCESSTLHTESSISIRQHTCILRLLVRNPSFARGKRSIYRSLAAVVQYAICMHPTVIFFPEEKACYSVLMKYLYVARI
jgi:hypothetical protein